MGVNIDDNLNFSDRVSNICKKKKNKEKKKKKKKKKESRKRLGVTNRLSKLIPAKAKLQLFKAAILPDLTYCSTVWNCCKASDSRKLERVQERQS